MITKTEKICPQCKQLKDLHCYDKNKSSSDGYSGWCKNCAKSKRNFKKLTFTVDISYKDKEIPGTNLTLLDIKSERVTAKSGNKSTRKFASYRCKCGYEGRCELIQLQRGDTISCGRVECSYSRSGKAALEAKNKFVEECNKIHDYFYDYTKVDYVNCNIKVVIICPKHGQFLQTPNEHLRGSGCTNCAIDDTKLTWEEFATKAKEIHNSKYVYSQQDYINNKTKIKIICPKHGQFLQTPKGHLAGRGCPKCSTSISKPETKWLDSLGLPNDPQHRQVSIQIGKKKIVADGYDPQTNTVYEFHGDFWHGNIKIYNPQDRNPRSKKTFGELFEATTRKSQAIRGAGYNLISIWESDWEKINKKINNRS